MHVSLRLHGELSRYLDGNRDRAEVDVPEGSTIASVLTTLGLPHQQFVMHAVNGAATPIDTPLNPGDILECVAPMSGG